MAPGYRRMRKWSPHAARKERLFSFSSFLISLAVLLNEAVSCMVEKDGNLIRISRIQYQHQSTWKQIRGKIAVNPSNMQISAHAVYACFCFICSRCYTDILCPPCTYLFECVVKMIPSQHFTEYLCEHTRSITDLYKHTHSRKQRVRQVA